MVTFNRLADIPGVSYSGPTRRIKGKWPQARFARELASDTSVKPDKLLRRLDIALELPGEPIDYHLLIERTSELLFWRRREHPYSLDEVERLAKLDLELIEAYPEMIEFEPGRYYEVATFLRLVRLYEREGELREALKIAERGASCNQEGLARRTAQLRARVAALEEVDQAQASKMPGARPDPNAHAIREFLDRERTRGLSKRFADLDSLIGRVVVRALTGDRPIAGGGHRVHAPVFVLEDATHGEQELLGEFFSLQKQRARGAWWIPEEVSAWIGAIHFSAILAERGRFAHSFAVAERYSRTSAESSAVAVLIHTVLNPLFSALYEPFGLRGEQTAKLKRETEIARWEKAEQFFADLGFDVDEELSTMRPGSGWWKLSASERLEAKRRLSKALAEQVEPEVAARYRARRLLALTHRYYSKADPEGRALSGKVLTSELELTVSGFFGGGWLDVLDYLGKAPHRDEQVVGSNPEANLRIGGADASGKIVQVHPDPTTSLRGPVKGLDPAPVERRIEALKRFWEIFDDLHARQKSGMPSLWGLVDDYGHLFPEVLYRGGNPRDAERPHRPGLYRTLLPESLRHEMEQLWGTTMLLGYPGRIVSEPLPVVRMAEAFGPALEFWEGTALTAWFLCEGPYSRTNMRGLERYHAKALDYLEKLGTPVEKTVFEDLTTEETHLGPEKEADLSLSNREVVPGTIVQIGASYVYGREGFERLREVVTRSRRAWAEKNLDRYLRARPEAEIRRAATAYNLTTLRRRGKPPTLKQFAKDAEKAARLWFGGDMAMLYRAFGEEPSFESTPSHLLPKDVAAFAADVYQALGGEKLPPLSWRNAQQLEREAYEKRQRRERARASLATKAIGYVQVMEALGRSPTFKEFARLGSPSGLEYAIREALDQEPSEAYSAYATIVEQALAGA